MHYLLYCLFLSLVHFFVRGDDVEITVLLPGSGIGSSLVCSFIAHIYLSYVKLPLYLDESKSAIFSRNLTSMNHYLDTNYVPYKSNKSNITFINLFCTKESMFTVQTKVLHNDLIQNMKIIQGYMLKFWRLTDHILNFIKKETLKLNIGNGDYATFMMRGGDKITVEHMSPPDMNTIVQLIRSHNFSNIHLITDSYHFYQLLRKKLPMHINIFTTAEPHHTGFFMKDIKDLSDEAMDQEILMTLMNYELSRKATFAFVDFKTNIGVWVALLRIMDLKSYQIINEEQPNFSYFGNLPLIFP